MTEALVKISTGSLLGKTCNDFNNSPFLSFQGIPYAKPPIGDLRFKAPEPVEPWTGVKNAQNEGSECLQMYDNGLPETIAGSEDCLNLNVYTHKVIGNNSKPDPKPVMVHIHGGSFTSGSNKTDIFGPEYLMTEDIVLVVINYRLNIFGFLNFEDESLDIPGNAGMKDMILALKWVQTNIEYFNGDPNNVTIFGESAGGAAVHYLVLSPLAKGLFHKAIIQSGVASNLWACGKNCTEELAKILKLNSTEEQDVLNRLMEMPGEEVLKLSKQTKDIFLASEHRPFAPTIEKPSENAFISEHPEKILQSGKYNSVPIIIGYASREGMLIEFFSKTNPKSYEVINFEESIPFTLNVKDKKKLAQQIKEFYFGDEEPTTENKDSRYLLDGDNLFVREILRSVELHVKTSSQPVYLYRLSLETKINFLKVFAQINAPGASHGDDIGYLFKIHLLPNEIELGKDELNGIKRFVTLWTNFAKTGDPNLKEKNELINVDWKPVSTDKICYLDIDKKLTIQQDPEKERMDFWKKIFEENS